MNLLFREDWGRNWNGSFRRLSDTALMVELDLAKDFNTVNVRVVVNDFVMLGANQDEVVATVPFLIGQRGGTARPLAVFSHDVCNLTDDRLFTIRSDKDQTLPAIGECANVAGH